MENRINIAAHRLAILFADDTDIPSRFKKTEKRKKVNLSSGIELRFKEDIALWNKTILTILEKIENELAWRFINISPRINNELKSVAYQNDFCEFIDYLVLRRDKENCDADELGRLAMLSGALQKELERKLNPTE